MGGIGAGLARIATNLEGLAFAPDVMRGFWLRLAGGTTTVALVRCESYAGATEAVREAWRLAKAPPVRGARVVLKPNLVDTLADRQVHTAPEVVGALIDLLKNEGAREVIVADGPCFSRDSSHLLEKSGLGRVVEEGGVAFVDLNYDDLVEVALSGNYGRRFRTLLLPKTVVNCDLLVSVPKLKVHHWTGVSLSMKNLFGVVPGTKYGWPKNTLHYNGIEASILALYATLKPQVAVVDAVVGLEGDGPIYGTERYTGVIAAGTDLVAVDAACARVMGIDPVRVDHLRLAADLGLGRLQPSQIHIAGMPIEAVRQQYREPPLGLSLIHGS